VGVGFGIQSRNQGIGLHHGMMADLCKKASLKHEQLNFEKFKTQEAAKLSMIDYLDFYNGRRSHSTFGYQSPSEFEREFYSNAARTAVRLLLNIT